ncbi:MAG TPA: peptidoglycan DD-metalloendopeptidase family protein [Bacteroidales bacterium]|nr:peptidoglycan DD-metalloendopeptidase family protein [Bacteroidales bacterium]
MPALRNISVFLFFLSVTLSCRNIHNAETGSGEAAPDSAALILQKEPVLVFGIPSDSFNLIPGHIKPNGFLSQILLEHGVTMQEIDQVIKNSKSVFDVRNIRSGNSYTLFCDTGSLSRARYLVYEHDPTTCYIFSFRDSLNITPFRKEIRKVIKYSSGTIETSLWDAMINGGMHPSLAVQLSDIFAWTVDFFGLQKGDSFKVIYEESFIDDKSLGAGRIFGAQFSWSGKTITAVPFIQDGKESFFEDDGNSLRKAFLKAPLSFSRITSRFSSSRMHPILRIRRPHYGVDYAAPIGTPVHAVGDGRVISTTIENGSGRMVKISHNSVYSTAYLHLSRFGDGIQAGVFVKQGDIIGYVGSSGLSTGPHLDFRFYQNGYPIDPLKVVAPPVEPVSDANKGRFEINKNVVLSLLSTF